MSLHELSQVLAPRKLEPRLLRDLTARSDAGRDTRVIRSAVMNALLAGKIRAVRQLHRHHDYSLGEYDMLTVQTLRQKYLNDLRRIRDDQVYDEPAKTQQRLAALSSALVWETYNLGKLSSFRQRSEGKIGDATRRGQMYYVEIDPRDLIFWITEMDDKVCDICMGYEMESARIGGWPIWSQIPSIPDDSHPFCRCSYESGETK